MGADGGQDLRERGAGALVIAGARQPALVHAIAAAINALLGSAAVSYARPALEDLTAGPASIAALAREIEAGHVDTLVMSAWNPAYAAPADLGLGDLLARVPNTLYHGLFEDETAGRSAWFLPATHELESWGDARALDGTVSLTQPLIEPLWEASARPKCWRRSSGSPSEARSGCCARRGRRAPRADFAGWWDATLQRGVVEGTAFSAETVTVDWPRVGAAIAALRRRRAPKGSRSAFAPTRASSTGASPTAPGCKSCPIRSPSSPGPTRWSSARAPRRASGSRPRIASRSRSRGAR